MEIYEDLAKKILQWEPSNEEFRNSNSISSERGLHSIEDSIATEAKLANIMRRLEVIELRNPVSVNQLSSTSPAGCTYCQAMNHVFEECPVFMAHQMLPEHMNAAFSRPPAIHIHRRTISVGESPKFLMGLKHQ